MLRSNKENNTFMTYESDSLTNDSVLDTLTNDSVPLVSDDGGDSLTTDSVLDTLTPDSVPAVVGLDWERDGWRVSVNGVDPEFMSKEALLTATFADADYVVVEQAHMRERDVYSVAQVYTEDELRSLPFRDKIRLFPGMPGQLGRAARAVGNVTGELDKWGNPVPDKTKDAQTMSLYAQQSPAQLASWKCLKLPDEDPSRRLWPARDAIREDMKRTMNKVRVAWNAKPTAEKYALPEVVMFCGFLDAVMDDLTDGVKEQFGIRRSSKGIRVERMSAALTVFLAVRHRDGTLRTRPDGEFVGIRFLLDTIGMSSSYRPNLSRSQLTYHGMRHYKGGRDGGCRGEYMRNLRHFMQIIRDFDGDSLTVDSVLDTLTSNSVPVDPAGDSLTVDSVLDTLTSYSEPCGNTTKEVAATR
jgi:hypothetical protein